MRGNDDAVISRQRGWIGLVIILLALAIVAVLAQTALKRYGLLGEDRTTTKAAGPRGVGPTRWSATSRFDGKQVGQHIRRRFLLLGQTLEGQQVWDVRRGIICIGTIDELKMCKLSLQATGEMAGIGLYAGLFEPTVASFDLWHPPSSHRRGPTFMNVMTILDMPQAVALALPRPVNLHLKADEAKRWEWTEALQKAIGGDAIRLFVAVGMSE